MFDVSLFIQRDNVKMSSLRGTKQSPISKSALYSWGLLRTSQ
jgi:hypothetical protein